MQIWMNSWGDTAIVWMDKDPANPLGCIKPGKKRDTPPIVVWDTLGARDWKMPYRFIVMFWSLIGHFWWISGYSRIILKNSWFCHFLKLFFLFLNIFLNQFFIVFFWWNCGSWRKILKPSRFYCVLYWFFHHFSLHGWTFGHSRKLLKNSRYYHFLIVLNQLFIISGFLGELLEILGKYWTTRGFIMFYHAFVIMSVFWVKVRNF